VIIAAVFVVGKLRVETLRWLVMIVVAYASVSMLRSALREPRPVVGAASGA